MLGNVKVGDRDMRKIACAAAAVAGLAGLYFAIFSFECYAGMRIFWPIFEELSRFHIYSPFQDIFDGIRATSYFDLLAPFVSLGGGILLLAGAWAIAKLHYRAKFLLRSGAALLTVAFLHTIITFFVYSFFDVLFALHIVIPLLFAGVSVVFVSRVPLHPAPQRQPRRSAAELLDDSSTFTVISGELYGAFISKNTEYYLPRFAESAAVGGNYRFSFNLAAFLFPQSWLFYRKMYFWGIIAFLLCTVFNLIGWLVSGIITGCAANWTYYRHASGKLLPIAGQENAAPIAMLLGGTNPLLAGIILFLNLISVVLAVGGIGLLMML